jgi:hypothetical protein
MEIDRKSRFPAYHILSGIQDEQYEINHFTLARRPRGALA